MRIWSIHPKYLDSKGLVALWRETLLAKNVLSGNTKGYVNHPQLIRFKALNKPIDAVNFYLSEVWKEALKRNYNFDKSKFIENNYNQIISVTSKQIKFETEHLKQKLLKRDVKKYNEFKDIQIFEAHPIFNITEGEIELWEKIY